jgi:hypothetical protein
MQIWRRFSVAAVRWALVLGALAAMQGLLLAWSDEFGHGGMGILLELRGVSGWLAQFLPLIAFAAAVEASSSITPGDLRTHARGLALAALSVAALTYLWNAFLDPWVDAALLARFASSMGGNVDVSTQTQPWLAERLAMPGNDPQETRVLGWQLHISNALALLAMLLTAIGFLAGSRASTSAHRWVIVTVIIIAVAPTLLWSLEMSSRFAVPAVLSSYGILLVPMILLTCLLWVAWTESARFGAVPATG